jgi:hypothetical protein
LVYNNFIKPPGGYMNSRSGEKAGWIGGWTGAFLWALILAILWLAQGKTTPGIVGLTLVLLAAVAVYAAEPWKHPTTQYWKLLLIPFLVLAANVIWAVRSLQGEGDIGLNWWSLLLLLPLLIPFATIGGKRWSDFEENPPQGRDALRGTGER